MTDGTPERSSCSCPLGNAVCAAAAQRYRRCLTDTDTFDVRTLDDVVQAARLATADPWPAQVHERYLDPTQVNDAAAATIRGGSR